MKLIDLSGKRFGKLLVLSRAKCKNKNIAWACVCDCGGRTNAYRGNLQSGHTKSCGCIRDETRRRNQVRMTAVCSARRTEVMIGQSFGRLVVLSRAGKQGRSDLWRCRCVCGETKEIRTNSLTSGNTTSCGCRNRECTSERNKKRAINLAGKTYSYLTVVARSGSRHGVALWLCVCVCGNYVNVKSSVLISAAAQSCGCLHYDLTLRNQRYPHLPLADVADYRRLLQATRKVEQCLTQTK